ncbi:MAG: type I phosphomannose isomerase catalytic subunit, partial [Bacteroidota bacterium]
MEDTKLYPLKFQPILKDKIWGGRKLHDTLFKKEASNTCGESWEISGVKGDVSIVSNGFLAGNDLSEILEVYMGEVVGEKVYDKFGNEFPLLIKFIDANDNLSIQVHPDDELAQIRHNSFGKTEMWYIIESEKEARLIMGFNKELTKEEYLEKIENTQLESILNYVPVKPGDVFFMPAGRVHAIGAGILLAEIQQTSDVTYRIYDFDRKDDNGNTRELHTDLAVDAIDYTYHSDYKTHYDSKKNEPVELVDCPYFTTNILDISAPHKRDFTKMDSFVIYMCTEGKAEIKVRTGSETIQKGETILVPAILNDFEIIPDKQTKLLEVYI